MSSISFDPTHRLSGMSLDAERPNLLAGAQLLGPKATMKVGGLSIQGEPNFIETVTHANIARQTVYRGRLMSAFTTSGNRVFWLQGQGTAKYLLRGAEGKPVSNLPDAQARAQELISSGAATQLSGTRIKRLPEATVTANAGTQSTSISVNLEDPAINPKGGKGRRVEGLISRGNEGSALTSSQAVANAQSLGVPVQVINSNPNLNANSARWNAYLSLPNTVEGGKLYGRITINRNPGQFDPSATTYALPRNANAEFKRGYNEVSVEINGWAALGAAQNAAAGRANATAARPTVLRNGGVVVSAPVTRGASNPSGQFPKPQPPTARPAPATPPSSTTTSTSASTSARSARPQARADTNSVANARSGASNNVVPFQRATATAGASGQARSPASDGTVQARAQTQAAGRLSKAPKASNEAPRLPEPPKEVDHSAAGLSRAFKSIKNVMLQQRLSDYQKGRSTREQATEGLKGEERTRMNGWLDAIDRSRLPPGGATGGRSASAAGDANGGNRTPSFSNLPMGQVVWGKVKVPKTYTAPPWPEKVEMPFTPSQASQSSLVPRNNNGVRATDPISGKTIVIDSKGRLRPAGESKFTNQTAKVASLDTMPHVPTDPKKTTFQRNGTTFSVKFSVFGASVNVWRGNDPEGLPDVQSVVNELGALRPRTQSELIAQIDRALSARFGNTRGWNIRPITPSASIATVQSGIVTGNYLEFGNLDSLLTSGAVLYNPAAPIGSRYTVNTRNNAEGKPTLAVPLPVTLGVRLAASPTSWPVLNQSPVKVSTSRSSELKITLRGEINAELLSAINQGLNNPFGQQIWRDQGSLQSRSVRQVNFAPANLPKLPGVSYDLPTGWKNLESKLTTSEERQSHKWSTFTSGTAAIGTSGPASVSVGRRTERVERPATDTNTLIRGQYVGQPRPGKLAVRSEVTPFTFSVPPAGSANQHLVEVLPNDASAQRREGQQVVPNVLGTLIAAGKKSLKMPGAALNAINQHPLRDSDLVLINTFLRSMDPPAAPGQISDTAMYEVARDFRDGAALSARGVAAIRAAISAYRDR